LRCQGLQLLGYTALMRKLDRITVDPAVCLGQPTVRSLRITVSLLLKLLADGKTADDILQLYPELEPEDIRQAIQYAAWGRVRSGARRPRRVRSYAGASPAVPR